MFANGLRAFSGVTVGFGGALIGIHASLALSAAALFVLLMSLLAWAQRVAHHEASKAVPGAAAGS
jgi:hypothetical protein